LKIKKKIIFMRIPIAVQKLTESFERLPGIGPKTAQRLTFYLLHVPQEMLENFSVAIGDLKKNTKECSLCHTVDEQNPCSICGDPVRDKTRICIVEEPLDVLAIEKSGVYKGLYHVLGGVINPLNNIGPQELYIYDFLPRLENSDIIEVILATNPTMEGEATALFISQMVTKKLPQIKITRIGRGLPTGADLQYADELTLKKALEGRREY